MALMIPVSISNLDGVTDGEIKLFDVLRAFLPDNYYVWYDAMIKGKRPDFIVVGPDLGIIILEVKDWEIGSIIEANTEYFTLRTTGRKPANPLNQARNYIRALLDTLQEETSLKQSEGRYTGNLKFNWGYGAVFTRIARKDFLSKDYANVIDHKFLLFKDDFDHLQKSANASLLDKLRDMIPSDFRFPVLREDDVEKIRMIISREKRPNENESSMYYVAEPRVEYGAQNSSKAHREISAPVRENNVSSGKRAKSNDKQNLGNKHADEKNSRPVKDGGDNVAEQIGDTQQTNIMKQQAEIQHQMEENRTRAKGNASILKYLIIAIVILALFVILTFKIGNVVNQPDVQAQNVTRGTSIDAETKSASIKPISSEDSKKDNQSESIVVKNKDKVKPTPVVKDVLRGTKTIKGNINQAGEKIYHLPGQRFYERTKPEKNFRTEEEAMAAGFRKAKDPRIKGHINRQGEKIYHMMGQAYYQKVKAEECFFTEEEAQEAGYRKSKR